MLKPLSRIDIDKLIGTSTGPAVSLYLPTHRSGPEIQQDPIRLKNLLREAEEQLGKLGMRSSDVEELLKPARQLQSDGLFWRHQREGLAIFLAKGFDVHYRLPLRFEELAVVAERFHVKPLLPLLTGDGRFYVLALSQKEVRLLQGSRHSVSQVELEELPNSLQEALGREEWQKQIQFHTPGPSFGADRAAVFHGHGGGDEGGKNELLRFFRQVDGAITDFLQDDRSPLVLAGVDYYFPIYREASTYPHLVGGGVPGNPEPQKAEELHGRALELVAPLFEKEREEGGARYRELAGTGRTSNDIAETVSAAVQGRVDTLFVTVGQQVWGRIGDDGTGVERHDSPEPGDLDLLDLAAVRVLQQRGKVFAVDSEEMPDGAPLAAVFRY